MIKTELTLEFSFLQKNFKLYIQINKAIKINNKSFCKILITLNKFRNMMLRNFEIELYLDRQTNSTINLSIFKLQIEDVSNDEEIASPFRVN